MPSKIDLTRRRFGKLVALSMSHQDRFKAYYWSCRCDCGKETVVRASQLKTGVSRSCGCGISESASRPRTHGQTGTPLYKRWRAMLARTSNANNSEYHNYGGRGILVCDPWKSFENFANDMGATFSPELELERDDVNGNYDPRNCRWATRKEQQRNRRTNNRVEWGGQILTAQEWGERLGILPNTIIYRLRRGWPVKRALTTGAKHGALLEIANA